MPAVAKTWSFMKSAYERPDAPSMTQPSAAYPHDTVQVFMPGGNRSGSRTTFTSAAPSRTNAPVIVIVLVICRMTASTSMHQEHVETVGASSSGQLRRIGAPARPASPFRLEPTGTPRSPSTASTRGHSVLERRRLAAGRRSVKLSRTPWRRRCGPPRRWRWIFRECCAGKRGGDQFIDACSALKCRPDWEAPAVANSATPARTETPDE